MKYGVVAVQGDVDEHREAAERAASALDVEVETISVSTPADVRESDVIALPGGESTTISRHVEEDGLADALRRHVEDGGGVLATCAGLIVAARDAADDRVRNLGLVDVDVTRNAFGRQKESFEASVDVEDLETPFPGVFIRAPVVESVGEAEVLAEHEDRVVAVRGGPEDNVVGTSFHPELTDDSRLHELVFEDER